MPRKDANFKLESESEASVIGSCFAEAITLLANKQHNQFNRPIIPRKKVFWEETRYNPPLANTHISAGYEAHLTEERLHWSRRGRRFPPELPQPSREKDKGPKKPEEFPKIFEKPVPVILRRNESRTFTDVFKSSHAYTKDVGSLKAMLEDPPITPLTYKIPDYWKSGELSQHGSPVFLSSSKRFSEIHESSAEPIVELKVTNSISKSGYSRTPEIGSLNNLRRPKSSQQILLSKVKGYSFSRKDLKSSPSSIMMAENFDESAKKTSVAFDVSENNHLLPLIVRWSPPSTIVRSTSPN